MVTRGFETRLQILSPHKKSIGWAVGAEVTSCRYYGRRKPDFSGFETRLLILSPHKKSIGWAVGAEVTSRRCYYGRRKQNF